MAEYRLSPAAEKDMESIWLYTHKKWGEAQAGRYTDKLTDVFSELAQAPTAAAACESIRAGYRRRNVERHMIYFRVTTYGIVIVRILHERMDALRHL